MCVKEKRDGFSAGPGLTEAIRKMAPLGSIALDLGTGNLITSKALAVNCKQVFSLEEEKSRAESVSLAAPARINVLYSPLQKGHYQYQYFGQLDLIVIDGPRGNIRSGCLPWLTNLKYGGLVFVDDTHRSQIRNLVSAIQCMGFQKIVEGKNGKDRTWCIMKKTGKLDTLVDLLLMSYNRSEYTRMTLESLHQIDCGIPWDRVKFTVIDQASNDDSIYEIARFIRSHSGLIDDFIVADKNYGAAGGISYFLANCRPKSSFIGKIDNDSIFTTGWLKNLIASLQAHPKLGIVGAQQNADQGKNERAIVNALGIGYYPARFVGGRFAARKQVFTNRVPKGCGVWGWTQFQQHNVKNWHIGWCIPASVIEHVGDWNFRHPKAIKNNKYIDYFKATGRLRK